MPGTIFWCHSRVVTLRALLLPFLFVAFLYFSIDLVNICPLIKICLFMFDLSQSSGSESPALFGFSVFWWLGETIMPHYDVSLFSIKAIVHNLRRKPLLSCWLRPVASVSLSEQIF